MSSDLGNASNSTPPVSAQDIEGTSPSLRSDFDGVAFEIKFLLPAAIAKAVLELTRQNMRLDPHCDKRLGDAYEVHGLYFDTDSFQVYHRCDFHAVHKLRLRRYGQMSSVFLEHKSKIQGKVKKRRSLIAAQEVPFLFASGAPTQWSGAWFGKRMRARELFPKCEISYLRSAFIGGEGMTAYRLTIDRHLRCRPFMDWELRGVNEGISTLPEQMILELKFCEVMPLFFKNLLADLQLSPQRISKYRQCADACGLIPTNGSAGASLAS